MTKKNGSSNSDWATGTVQEASSCGHENHDRLSTLGCQSSGGPRGDDGQEPLQALAKGRQVCQLIQQILLELLYVGQQGDCIEAYVLGRVRCRKLSTSVLELLHQQRMRCQAGKQVPKSIVKL